MNHQHIHIDSADATTGNSNSFTVNLSYPIKTRKLLFINVSIPTSFYNVNSLNNQITFVDTSSATKTGIIPVGNYAGAALATAIATAMNGAGGSGTYACSLTTLTNKFTINETSGPTNFGLNFASGSNQIKNVIGFTATNLTGASTYTSQNVANIVGPDYIYIKSNTLSSIVNPTLFKGLHSNVILKIPNNTAFLGTMVYNNNLVDNYIDFGDKEVSLQNIDFQLVYSNGDQVDLNGNNWSISMIAMY